MSAQLPLMHHEGILKQKAFTRFLSISHTGLSEKQKRMLALINHNPALLVE